MPDIPRATLSNVKKKKRVVLDYFIMSYKLLWSCMWFEMPTEYFKLSVRLSHFYIGRGSSSLRQRVIFCIKLYGSKDQLFSVNFHFTASERLPRWAEGWYRHAPEQGAAPAASVWVSQQGLPAFPLPHHQDLLLRSRGVPHPAGRRLAGYLFRLLRFHGGPERQHCAGYPR